MQTFQPLKKRMNQNDRLRLIYFSLHDFSHISLAFALPSPLLPFPSSHYIRVRTRRIYILVDFKGEVNRISVIGNRFSIRHSKSISETAVNNPFVLLIDTTVQCQIHKMRIKTGTCSATMNSFITEYVVTALSRPLSYYWEDY